MSKKGFILIFIFIGSLLACFLILNAEVSEQEVGVKLNYYPNHYVEIGHCWVEFDEHLLDDNKVYGENDEIIFAFFYDVAVIDWRSSSFSGIQAYGCGRQADECFYCPQNN